MRRLRILRRGAVSPLRDERGSALLEFAIVLPLLMVFVVGIYDFSAAFDQKQKIEQAAQEGAIVAGAQPTGDIQPGNGNPNSLQPVVTAIVNSLTGSGAATGTCGSPPFSPTGPPAGLAWTYTILGCSNTHPTDPLVIVLNRGWVFASGSTGSAVAVGSSVSITFPYHWTFNKVIQLLIPGAPYAATTYLTESATVHNQM